MRCPKKENTKSPNKGQKRERASIEPVGQDIQAKRTIRSVSKTQTRMACSAKPVAQRATKKNEIKKKNLRN